MKQELINTPNGIISWTDAHHAIVAELYYRWSDDDESMNVIHEALMGQAGVTGTPALSKVLTDEFELKYDGQVWEGDDFVNAVDAFLDDKVESLISPI